MVVVVMTEEKCGITERDVCKEIVVFADYGDGLSRSPHCARVGQNRSIVLDRKGRDFCAGA